MGNCQKVIFLWRQSTNSLYASHPWQKHWMWVKAKQALIHIILESHRGNFCSHSLWRAPLFSLCPSLEPGPCIHPHCSADHNQLCAVLLLPVLTQNTFGAWALLARSHIHGSQGKSSRCLSVEVQMEHLKCCLEGIYDTLSILNATFTGHHSPEQDVSSLSKYYWCMKRYWFSSASAPQIRNVYVPCGLLH